MTVRILLVDDHAMVRTGVRAELASAHTEPPIEIVGEADDVESAVRRIHELTPDVVLLDVHLPGGWSGREGARCCSGARTSPVRCGSWPCRSRTPPRT